MLSHPGLSKHHSRYGPSITIVPATQAPPEVELLASIRRSDEKSLRTLHVLLILCILPSSSGAVEFSRYLNIPSHIIHHQGSSNPGSSPVLQLHLIHEDGREILVRKLLRSELPGDLSMLGLPECICEFRLLDLGVLDLGGVEIGVVDLGGVEVGVVDFGGVPLGVVDLGGVSFGVVDLEVLAFGLPVRLPHREVGLLLQRQRVLLSCRKLGLLG